MQLTFTFRAPSTRIVASMWWFFTLIMVSSYTANLAAFLTIENPMSAINSVEDLVKPENKIPYGAKKTGSTIDFFKESENKVFSEMYKFMSNPDNSQYMLDGNDEGLARAMKGKYAYLMESSTIEYLTQRNCDVSQVGGKLDEKGYGIAMKKS